MDVSVLWLQGATFVTQAMAGNNRLGGQDFNDRVQKHILTVFHLPYTFILILQKLKEKYGKDITDNEDIQQIRLEVEQAKLRLTEVPVARLNLDLKTTGKWSYEVGSFFLHLSRNFS